jgi:hypothetical protein
LVPLGLLRHEPCHLLRKGSPMSRVKGVDWDLEGEQLSIKWALALGRYAGFLGERLCIAVSVMWAESGRWTRAWNINRNEDGTVRSIDRGLFQINSAAHPDVSEVEAFHPITNAEYASFLSRRGQHWGAWNAFTSGRYLLFYPLVRAVYALGTWRSRVDKVEERFG